MRILFKITFGASRERTENQKKIRMKTYLRDNFSFGLKGMVNFLYLYGKSGLLKMDGSQETEDGRIRMHQPVK